MKNIHFKSAWDHIKRSPFQAMAAVFVLTLTFFVTTVTAITVYASGQLIKYFETQPQVIVFLKGDAKPEDVNALENKLINDIRLKNVKYVSKEQALEIYKKATSDNPLLSELVSPSIFPASLEFSLNNIGDAQNVINELKGNQVVDEVGFTASLGGQNKLTDVVQRLKNLTIYVRIAGGAFAIFLTGTSFLVLLVIISMRMNMRKGEMEVLNLIGATPGFIRSPILLEALIYALAGVLIGWTGALILVLYATPGILSYFGQIPVLPHDAFQLMELFGAIFLGEIIIGIFLALFGSMLALARINKKK